MPIPLLAESLEKAGCGGGDGGGRAGREEGRREKAVGKADSDGQA